MTEDRDKAKEERQNAVKEVSQLKKDRDKEKEERQNNAKANRQLKVTVRKFLCQALIERWGRVLAGAVGDLMPTPKKKTPQERKAYWKYKAPSSVFFDLFRFIIDDSHPESSTFRPPRYMISGSGRDPGCKLPEPWLKPPSPQTHANLAPNRTQGRSRSGSMPHPILDTAVPIPFHL